jgi:nicotinic acid mononucleotide adenylyltransferase
MLRKFFTFVLLSGLLHGAHSVSPEPDPAARDFEPAVRLASRFLAPRSDVAGVAPLNGTVTDPAERARIIELGNTLDDMRDRIQDRFERLDRYDYLRESHIRDFQQFLPELLGLIDRIIEKNEKKPMRSLLYPDDFPNKKADFENKEINVGLLMGSFSPFHLGHLINALRHLANPETRSDVVLIVPNQDAELEQDPLKPHKIPFRYRWKWLEQQTRDFAKLFRMWNAGKTRDTRLVVEKLIKQHPGYTIRLSQLMGSDVLPRVAELIKADFQKWQEVATLYGTRFEYTLHINERLGYEISPEQLKNYRFPPGINVLFTRKGETRHAPSSSRFLTGREVSIFYPDTEFMRDFAFAFIFNMWGVPRQAREILDALNQNGHLDDPRLLKRVLDLIHSAS